MTRQCNLISLATLILCLMTQTATAKIHNLAEIEKQVYDFVYRAHKADKPNIEVRKIDRRLRLKQCGERLFIDWHSPLRAGNSLIKVACQTTKPWKLYVPVKLRIYKDVYVAKIDIARGETLSSSNTIKKRQDIGQLHHGYIESIQAYDTRKLRRYVKKHTVLHHKLFEIRHMVKRGQQILLETGNDTLAVKVKATALDNGQKGDLIKVRNNSSAKVVEAIVESANKAVVIH